ncbi:MAG: EamA family transporter RarD [Desulfobacterales bacterium]|nr:EamA family transporter RarD [Desulfobacterales bacterium]
MQNKSHTISKPVSESSLGVSYASAAYLIWGLAPLYWKELDFVPALEIIMHRIVWSFLFLIPLLLLLGRVNEFITAVKNRRTLMALILTAFLIWCNWFVFIWAVNHGHILQTSLGYYINPLISVLMGMIFLKERLRPMQVVAVILAGTGVVYLTVQYGEFPVISLALAFSFGSYGLVRKIAPVGSVAGLSVETLILSFPALAYLLYSDVSGTGTFLRVNTRTDLFLIGTSLFTAVPLIFFTLGAKRLHLSTVGFLQYIAPSCCFILAVFVFHEPISKVQIHTFMMIWAALFIYSADSLIKLKFET